ncbi:MAG: histidine phosphatase family protein [Cytophagales bacterium]|nr:histidine phosphatase family protein [Cytophagales bacterium]
MKKRIYLLRHGETDYNKQRKVQGRRIDAPLNEKGRRQAQAFYEHYKHLEVELCAHSGLVRTRQTISGFIDQGYPVFQSKGFDELDYGLWEGQSMAGSFQEEFVQLMGDWDEGQLAKSAPEGETPLNVMKRQKEAFADLMKRPESTVLLCMHSRAIRILLCWLQCVDLSEMSQWGSENTGLTILEIEQGEELKANVLTFNSTEHISAQMGN